MVWIATALTVAAGAYGAYEKKKAQASANAANESRYGQSLGLVGWGWDPNQTVAPQFSQGDLLFQYLQDAGIGFPSKSRNKGTFADTISGYLDAGAGSALVSGIVGKHADEGKVKGWIADYLSGDPAKSTAAKKMLASLPGMTPGMLGQLNKQAEDAFKASSGQLTLTAMLARSFDRAEAALNAQGKQIEQGYARAAKQAISATASAGQTAYRNVVSDERKALAESEAGLARRGLYSTTVGTGYKNQIRGAAGRAFGDIAERVGLVRGNLLSGLETARVSALSQHAGAMANFFLNKGQAQMGAGQSYLNIILGRNDYANPGFLDMIGGTQGLAGIYAGTKGLLDTYYKPKAA